MVKTRHVVYGHSTIIWDSVKNGMTKIPMKMDIWPSSNGISNLRYVTTILSIGGYIWYKYYDYTIQLTNIVAHMLPLYYPLSSPVIYPKIYPIINIPRNHHLHGGFKSHYIHYIQDSKNNVMWTSLNRMMTTPDLMEILYNIVSSCSLRWCGTIITNNRDINIY